MPRKFNTAGICRPAFDYMLDPKARLPQVDALIEEQAYFVLHAPRQTGKTTALLTLAQELTQGGRYLGALLSMETGDPFPLEIGAAEDAILDAWRRKIEHWLPPELQPPPWPEAPVGRRIGAALAAWARAAPRPLVLFLDEIDALADGALRSVLRQIREGYGDRPTGFPWSICLCGMRDVRDYKILSGGQDRLRSASPFNIKTESLTLRNFHADEVAALYQQHTDDTGQVFLPEAAARAFALTCGHPWLVNALARQATQVLVPDRHRPITAAHIDEAAELLIRRRDTHLDSLADKLHEERVRRIIEPILTGEQLSVDTLNDDLIYVRDLGLIAPDAPLRIANPIYQEVIPRALSFVMQEAIPPERAWYLKDNGQLDLVLLLASFQEFYAQHSEAWLARYDYQEAGPHLLLMAFLQRIINGGGRIHREFAVGSGRADLVVESQGGRGVIELKIRRGEHTEREGIEQLSRYLDRIGEPEGHLVLFDRRKAVGWGEKISIKETAGPSGQRIYVFGM